MLDSRVEGVKVEPVKEGESTVQKVFCPFCPEVLSSDTVLLEHMKMRHLREMFGCTKCSSSLQPVVAWSVDVLLQHLAAQHKLNTSIAEAIASYVEMPSSLH